MKNFVYNSCTKVYFGKGMIKNLSEEIMNYGTNVLLVYGKGSIKRNGVYSDIQKELKSCRVIEFGGVESNPRVETVRKAIEVAREHDVDIILAAGGGSVIDCSKLIAAGYYYEDDPWDLVTFPGEIEKALPIITVLTSFGTGSEMNGSAVINNEEEKQKISTYSHFLIPVVSVLDPVYTYSLSANLTAAGIADTISHAIESYFSKDTDTFLQDRISESIIKACLKYAAIAIVESDNYEARANLMWAGTLGLNGITYIGKTSAWSCHPMEHEISALYDIVHGVGMAVLIPKWMSYILSEKTVDKFAEYAMNIWNVPQGNDKFAMAKEAITMTEKFFVKCNLKTRIEEIEVDDKTIDLMALNAVKNGLLALAYVPLRKEDVVSIYKMCF